MISLKILYIGLISIYWKGKQNQTNMLGLIARIIIKFMLKVLNITWLLSIKNVLCQKMSLIVKGYIWLLLVWTELMVKLTQGLFKIRLFMEKANRKNIKDKSVLRRSALKKKDLRIKFGIVSNSTFFQARAASGCSISQSHVDTFDDKNKLNPWFVTGFADAEGTFSVYFSKSTSKLGMTVIPLFQIGLHKKDEQLIKDIQGYFGGIGSISYSKDLVFYKVQSLKQIVSIIMPHFDKYPLITQKLADYKLFKQIIMMMDKKEHLKKEGLQAIANIKVSLNLGFAESLKARDFSMEAFNLDPVSRPIINELDQKIPDPEWLAGFASGDGSFSISMWKDSKSKLGIRILARFILTQHLRDENLMKSLIDYLGCGRYSFRTTPYENGEYVVSKISDLTSKIIPFFIKHPIKGVKVLDFNDWCEVVELMKSNKHLTQKGLDQIIKIKSGMNKGRFQ